jgi:hypothetical protein
MRKLLTSLALTALAAVACKVNAPTAPPSPPAAYGIGVQVADKGTLAQLAGATVTDDILPPDGVSLTTDAHGQTLFANLTHAGFNVCVSAAGYVSMCLPVATPTNQNLTFALAPSIAPLPPAPTRDQVLHGRLSFDGLTVHVASAGDIPWFEAGLFSPEVTAAERAGSIYPVKRAAGDTAAILAIGGSGLLYDEPGTPYQAWHENDFKTDPAALQAAAEEIVDAGFQSIRVFLGGDGADGFPIASAELPYVCSTLAADKRGDLTPWLAILPGWDSVFYGYTPDQIGQYAALVHADCPRAYAALEFGAGHIPVGNGPSDYAPGGLMHGYDLLLGEFDVWPQRSDVEWQVLGRLLRPYTRPTDQPAGDDLSPPYYLANWGGVFVCFEPAEYDWVRGRLTDADIATMRAYYLAMGCAPGE